MPVLLAAAAALGLAFGSFLNVAVYRLPRHESLVRPGSHCPNCGSAVRARHNIPVLGWLLLSGKCADCVEPISLRYPMIELLTALVFVSAGVQVFHVSPGTSTAIYLAFAGTSLVLAAFGMSRRAPLAKTAAGLEN